MLLSDFVFIYFIIYFEKHISEQFVEFQVLSSWVQTRPYLLQIKKDKWEINAVYKRQPNAHMNIEELKPGLLVKMRP